MKKARFLSLVIPLSGALVLAGTAQGPHFKRYCGDAYENNDSRVRAALVGSITDCDSTSGSLSAVLEPLDEDWYTFRIDDQSLCALEGPVIDLVFPQATRYLSETYTVTVEVRCALDQSLAGLPVTWATTGSALSISVPVTQSCPSPGTDDTVDVTVRVQRTTSSLGCAPYRMTWRDGA